MISIPLIYTMRLDSTDMSFSIPSSLLVAILECANKKEGTFECSFGVKMEGV